MMRRSLIGVTVRRPDRLEALAAADRGDLDVPLVAARSSPVGLVALRRRSRASRARRDAAPVWSQTPDSSRARARGAATGTSGCAPGTRKRGRSIFRLRKRSSAEPAGGTTLISGPQSSFVRASTSRRRSVTEKPHDEHLGRVDDAPHFVQVDAVVRLIHRAIARAGQGVEHLVGRIALGPMPSGAQSARARSCRSRTGPRRCRPRRGDEDALRLLRVLDELRDVGLLHADLAELRRDLDVVAQRADGRHDLLAGLASPACRRR